MRRQSYVTVPHDTKIVYAVTGLEKSTILPDDLGQAAALESLKIKLGIAIIDEILDRKGPCVVRLEIAASEAFDMPELVLRAFVHDTKIIACPSCGRATAIWFGE